jgi:streptomycin 6-kinase
MAGGLIIPAALRASCDGVDERRAWLDALPRVIEDLVRRWSLTLGSPFDGEDVSCAWVAPAFRADGTRAVLKIGMPHFEGADEIKGLRFWNGDPTVFLLDADESVNALLLERCSGRSLRSRPEGDQDTVIAALLRRLWRNPPPEHPFRPLASMIDYWIEEVKSRRNTWLDRGVVRDGIMAFRDACDDESDAVVLATDLHAANVLESDREPWLVIDPKPFVGDRAYDATQHLLNCAARIREHPLDTINRFADLLAVDQERVRLWLFARTAAGPDSQNGASLALARVVARALS